MNSTSVAVEESSRAAEVGGGSEHFPVLLPGETPATTAVPLQLQLSYEYDQPGMALVSTLLNADNYLLWRRLMELALGSKAKLDFITGKFPKPAKEDKNYELWSSVDAMVQCWILNSVEQDIAKSLLCTTSDTATARDFWVELEKLFGFGGSNGLLIYQRHREMRSISQGNLSVDHYFNKISKLWNEIEYLQPLPECTCGALEQWVDRNRLMRFLTGLNDSYNHVRDQILLREPLPTVYKACSLVSSIEKLRKVHSSYSDPVVANHKDSLKGKSSFKKADKSHLKCTHCLFTGHTKDTCFKLHGTPDWYRARH